MRDYKTRTSKLRGRDMWSGTPLFPESASTMSGRVDALYFFLLALAAVFTILIAGLIVVYGIRFRRRLPGSIGQTINGGAGLEITWIVIPSLITVVIFL